MISLLNLYNSIQNTYLTFSEKTIIIDNIRWSYLDNNKKNCPIIIIFHGLHDNKNITWYPINKLLSQNYRIIIPDLIGHGNTKILDINEINYNFTIKNQIINLHKFIHSIDNIFNFHLLGHSMGSFLACYYTFNYPNDVITITIINIPLYYSNNNINYLYNYVLFPNTYNELKSFINLTLYNKNSIIFNDLIIRLYGYTYIKPHIYKKIFDQIILDNIFNIENLLYLIKKPVLIIWGKNDLITNYNIINNLKNKLVNIQTICLIDKCGHFPHYEYPDICANYIFYHISSNSNIS